MSEGEDYVTNTSRKSLRVLGSVGEPINPEAWRWYYDVVGSECPIVDLGGKRNRRNNDISIGWCYGYETRSATLPFFGIDPVIVDENNNQIEGPGEGSLCINMSWPGQMRTVYGDHQRFIDTYFKQYPGRYFSGDGCRRDEDGYH